MESLINHTGIVVIGRNEGVHLFRCLKSLLSQWPSPAPHPLPIVYVDSGSTDCSLETARRFPIFIYQLDPDLPYTAARARNEGVETLLKFCPQLKYVQFVDADCELYTGWLIQGSQALEKNPRLAAVFGQLEERFPGESIYNLLCHLEWKGPPGEVLHFAGLVLLRVNAWKELGGYDAAMIAGEEPEFSVRLREAGYEIQKLSFPMASHDARMMHFWQWWKRSYRSGHSIAECFSRHGRGPCREYAQERKSTLFWGCLIPLLACCLYWISPWVSLCILGLYLYLAFRIFRFRKRHFFEPLGEALLYASFVTLGKIPQFLGFLRYHVRRILGLGVRIVEYKKGEV